MNRRARSVCYVFIIPLARGSTPAELANPQHVAVGTELFASFFKKLGIIDPKCAAEAQKFCDVDAPLAELHF